MIIEIINRTKIAKEIIFKCDNCSSFYKKDYKKFFIDKPYHFCSVYCSNIQKKANGIIGNKTKLTCITKYGTDNVFQNQLIKDKSKQTLIDKYGEDNCSKIDTIKILKKESYMKKFGVEHPLKSIIIQNKLKKTLLDKYNVINVSQVKKFFEKAQNNMKGSHKTGYIIINNCKIFYRSSYEEKFLQILSTLNLNVISNIPIKYNWDGKLRTYFADFIVEYNDIKILFEIKPKSLMKTEQNISKFEAAKNFIKLNNIFKFVILTEDELFNKEFDLIKEFEYGAE